MPASIHTTCQPCRHACSIFLRISSGSVVSKPEVEFLSEYGSNKEAPQDPKAPEDRQLQRETNDSYNIPSMNSFTLRTFSLPFSP